MALQGQQCRVEGDDARIFLLAAEAATRLGLDHDRQLVAHVQRALHGLVDVVRALERPVDGDAAILAGDGDHRLVLDVELLLVPDAIDALDDELGGLHRFGRVAALDGVVGEFAVGLERVERRRQPLGSQPDVALRLAQRRPVGGRDQRAGLGLVADLAAHRHEHGLVVVDQADDVLAGDVVGGHDDHALPVERVVELDPQQARVRLGRANRRAEPGAGEHEIVGVLRLAGELGGALTAKGRGRPRSARGRRVGRNDQRAGVRRRPDRGRHAGRQGADVQAPALHRCIVAAAAAGYEA